MNSDGSNLKFLSNEHIENADPHWSQDGSKIIFYSQRDGNDEIYTMSPDGTNWTRLTNNQHSDQTPSISPDGSKIVFDSDRNGNADIFVMNVDGSDQRQLTFDPRDDRVPSWSPDGTKVLWYSRENSEVAGSSTKSWETSEIYELDLKTMERKKLTHNLQMDHGPVYSPDGEHIAFTSGRTGNREIFVMDKDGKNVKQLTFSK
jgi:Tol biopolymer transport system component